MKVIGRQVILFSILTLLVCSMLVVGAVSLNGNTKPIINDIVAVNIISYTDYYNFDGSTITDHNGLSYITNKDGIITLKKNNITVGSFYFALTGKINNIDQTYPSIDFDWTWSIYENTTNNDYILTGRNTKSDLNWTQEYYFFGDNREVMKIKHTILNNLGVVINNTKFWYVNNIKPKDTIRFNQINKVFKHNENINIKKNTYDDRSNFLPTVDFNSDYFFNYHDMIDSNSKIDFYMGNGLLVGHPRERIAAVGFDKGMFNPKTRLMIDPSVNSCQTLSESNETYILNQSILNTASICFAITGNYTTFDLNGNTIDGVNYQGAAVDSKGINATIKNGIIQEFSLGIRTLNDNNTIYNVTSRNNTVGIDIGGNYNTVVSSIIEQNGWGVRVLNSIKHTLIISNAFTGNTDIGIIFIRGPYNNNITLNNITGSNYGIYFYPRNNNNTITFNNISGSTRAVLVASASNEHSAYNIISNNQISSSGIELSSYSFNNVGSANCGGIIIDTGVDNNVTNATCGEPTTDLEILEIIPIQVVEDVDLVKDKTGIVRVVVRNNGPLDANATVDATLDGTTLDTFQGENNTKLILANQNQNFDFSFNPSSSGTNEIKAEVKVE